jgi:probable HAF family extracellular repeat protein
MFISSWLRVPPVFHRRRGGLAFLCAAGVSLAVLAGLTPAGGDTASAAVSGAARRPHELIGYRLIMLGSLGGQSSGSGAINNRGDVTGFSDTASSQIHSFLWRHGRMTDLGTLGGGFTFDRDINDRDQVVGTSDLPGYVPRAFVWQRGKMTDLGTLGNGDVGSAASAINNRGQIIGISINTSTDVLRGFVWQHGTMTDLGVDTPQDINDRGEIVGMTSDSAFVWQHGKITHLTGPSGTMLSDATLINDRGQIAGYGVEPAAPGIAAFLWQHGNLIWLGSLHNANDNIPLALNNLGQVLVHSGNGYFLWQDGQITDLASLGISATAGDSVSSMNDHGEIAGSVANAEGFPQAALWVPIYH